MLRGRQGHYQDKDKTAQKKALDRNFTPCAGTQHDRSITSPRKRLKDSQEPGNGKGARGEPPLPAFLKFAGPLGLPIWLLYVLPVTPSKYVGS